MTEEDVNEALRLMKKSKESVLLNEEEDEFEPDQSAQSKIYRLIKAMGRTDTGPRVRRMGRGPNRERDMDVDEGEEEDGQLLMANVRQRVLAQGYTETQLMDTIRSVSASFLFAALMLGADDVVLCSMRTWTSGSGRRITRS